MTIELTPELRDVQQSLRVLGERLLVKPLPYVHPVLATPGLEIQKGVVIAVGQGRRQRKLVGFKQNIGQTGRTLYFEDGAETGRVKPMQVKVGDVVEYSFRNIVIVDFDRIPRYWKHALGELAFIKESAVYNIDDRDDLNTICGAALMWQQSAGYDKDGNWMSGANWNKA